MVQEVTSLVLAGSHRLLSPCFCVRLLPAVIFVDIFSRGRESTDPNASRLYLLLRDAKRMLSTWAARNSIIIKSRGMIERCRMLIIAFRRVAAGRQVCFTVSTVPRRIGVVDSASYEFRDVVASQNSNELREKRFNSRAINEKNK